MDNILYKEKNGMGSEDNARRTIVNKILKLLASIDKEFYNKISTKYKGIEKYNALISDDRLSNFMFDVGVYVVSKINNKVRVESYVNALRVLYSKFYGLSNEEVEKMINETLEYNKKRAAIVFPTTYIIDQNGNMEIYSSIENKFESEDSAKAM